MASVRFLLATSIASLLAFASTTQANTIDLCRLNSEHPTEVLGELCATQMDLDAAQSRLERMAEKLVPEFGNEMQKRKNEFVRFGRSDLELVDGSAEVGHSIDMSKRKNEFVRFGKRKNEFVRFGKRKNEFVRFGKRADDGLEVMEKRKNEFVRFG